MIVIIENEIKNYGVSDEPVLVYVFQINLRRIKE